MSESSDADLAGAIVDFLTSEVRIGLAPKNLQKGALYWERRGSWEYPWRITAVRNGVCFGYPCGEPRKVSQ